MAARRPHIFYGYWIVLATFLCNAITFGCGFYAFSLFVTPLQGDLGWARGNIMAAFTIFFLTTGIVAPRAGRLVDRYGARIVMAAGAVIAAIGFIILSAVSQLWQYYLGYAVVGLGMAGTGQIPTSAVVSNWFFRKRGTAVGMMASGVGVGGLALAPFVGGVLLPRLGWNHTFLVLAALCVGVIVPLALLVIRTHPGEKGMSAYGSEAGNESLGGGVVRSSATLKATMGTAVFWFIVATYFLSTFAHAGAIQNQVPLLEDAGLPVAVSAGALGAVGLSSALGKFGFGWLCDRIQARLALAIGLGFQLCAVIVLMNIQSDSPAAMAWLYAVMMGIGIGSWLPTMSMLVSDYFGLAHYGAIFGALTISFSVGSALGPLVAGKMYDSAGNYDAVFVLFLVLFVVSVVSILVARRPTFGR